MFAAGFLTLLVMGLLFPNLWYGMHDITDLPVYWGYASRIAQGEAPYTKAFEVEYPPLAIALFRIPGHTGSESLYGIWFNILMGAIAVATGAVTAYVACRLWPRGGRAYVASVLFPVSVALIGTIVLNRYDMAVALLIAIFILCLCARWYTAAGFVIGMSFALKITPAALLPLVLLLAGPPRRWAWPLVAFFAAAIAPFVPYLMRSTSGVWHTFQYHLERPLQIESVLGTPQLLGQLLGADWASWAWSHGSHSLVAPGVGLMADMSGGLTLLAVAAVYLFAWLRRRPPAGGAGRPGHRRARAAARADDLLQGALAAVLHLDPAGVGAGRGARPLGGRPRRPHPRAHPGRVPGALLEPARHAEGAAGDRRRAQHAAAGDVRGDAVAGVAAAGAELRSPDTPHTLDTHPSALRAASQ